MATRWSGGGLTEETVWKFKTRTELPFSTGAYRPLNCPTSAPSWPRIFAAASSQKKKPRWPSKFASEKSPCNIGATRSRYHSSGSSLPRCGKWSSRHLHSPLSSWRFARIHVTGPYPTSHFEIAPTFIDSRPEMGRSTKWHRQRSASHLSH